MSSPDLHLTATDCRRCGKPLVAEWTAYPFPRGDGPRHSSCAQFAEAMAAHPDRFTPAPGATS